MCIKQLFVCFHTCSVCCWYGICCPVPTRSTVVSFPCTDNGRFLPGGRQESWSKVPLPCHLPQRIEKKTPAMITDFRMELNSGLSKFEAVLLRHWVMVITSPLPCLSGPASSPTLYHVDVDQPHHLPSTMFKKTTPITSPLPYWC